MLQVLLYTSVADNVERNTGRVNYERKKNAAVKSHHSAFKLAALPGFEPGKCWSQSPVPYRLAIALQHVL